jgi:formylglycine-generating enzyme required for sulfatase activity
MTTPDTMAGRNDAPAQRAPLRLRVFLASPGDVGDERALARQVLEHLAYDPLLRGKVIFEVVAWDQPGGEVPMLATMTPQAAIAAGLPKPSVCDIVVAVFWSRMGTPLPDEYRKPDGTRYLSGSEWEYLDALNAAGPTGRPAILVYRRIEEFLLNPDDPAYEEKLTQYRRVKTFFATFRNADGSIKHSCKEYVGPEDFRKALTEHLKAIIAPRLERVVAQTSGCEPQSSQALWPGSPFPGLRAFTPDDAPIFFGRGRETDALVRFLCAPAKRFVAVVGASGSGKSSLVAAGLLPRLQSNAIEGSKDWLLPTVIAGAEERRHWSGLRFTPGEAGENPFPATAFKLAPLLPDTALTPGKVSARLESDPSAIGAYVSDVLGNRPAWAEVLLFVDQFEELFSVVAERHRASFIALIGAAAAAPRVRTVVTMRADFYHRCLELPALAELLRGSTFPLAAPGPGALHEMITRPAARAGLAFDDGLPERVLEDTGTDPGALALLAFALHELYGAKTAQGRLTFTAYKDFGGVKGAISKRAESTFEELPTSGQGLLGAVFRELVEVNEQGVATRRRAKLADAAPSEEARALIDAFTDARLLVADRAPDGGATAEVSHEALLREWPRLADWIRDVAADLRTVRQAEAAAGEWERSGGDPTFLWTHERLVLVDEALAAIGKRRADLAQPVCGFLRPEAERLIEELTRPGTTHYRRAEIGDRFDRIGDPRPGVGLRSDGLPEIVWCDVPAGSVTLEKEPGTFNVKAFLIAKYPITFRQYKAFLDDPDGYRNRSWWKALKKEREPGEQYRPIGNCPADHVSWYDAMAFCRWLDAWLRKRTALPADTQLRLPTEWEWQQAATGGHSRFEYPWGPAWSDARANTWESRLGRTTAVGIYLDGASACAALDMAGNVWEWCLNRRDEPTAVSPAGDAARVLRGGSWVGNRGSCRCAYRNWGDPVNRDVDVGLRVCCAPPIP